MEAHVYNPSTWRQRQQDQEFKVILGYIASARLVWLKETSGQKRKSKSIIITKC